MLLTSPSSRGVLASATALGLLAISGALASQYLGGLAPCELCLLQRWPYYVGVPALAIATLLHGRLPPTWLGLLVLFAGALFAWGAWMGGYHAGVEWGFWPGPTSCTGAMQEIDLTSIMDMKPVVRCDVVQFRFLGVSLAGYNALLSALVAGLSAMSIVLLRRR